MTFPMRNLVLLWMGFQRELGRDWEDGKALNFLVKEEERGFWEPVMGFQFGQGEEWDEVNLFSNYYFPDTVAGTWCLGSLQ